MSESAFYQSVLASGLVPAEPLNRIQQYLDAQRSGTASALDTILFDISAAAPITLERLQRLPKVKDRFKHTAAPAPPAVKVIDAPLDADTAARKSWTADEKCLADELIRQGMLNAWQAEQLLEGRTKFMLGRCRMYDAIGQGGYGYVFLGRLINSRQMNGTPAAEEMKETAETAESAEAEKSAYVAVKVLPVSKAAPDIVKRFLHEAELQKTLRHPNLVRFIEAGQDGKVNYMIHEFMDGGDVRSLLLREKMLPLTAAVTIIAQIARAVQYLHDNGIVHRDIKPANILLSSNGAARLIDFGLAVPIDPQYMFFNVNESKADSAVLDPGRIAGTVAYMAPDQIRDPARPLPAWDIFPLGCSLYQMLTGVVPFPMSTPPSGNLQSALRSRLHAEPPDVRILNQHVPFDIAELLRLMLSPKPSERINSAEEVAQRLEPWIPPQGLFQHLAMGE